MWDLGERVIKGVEGRGLWRWDTVGGSGTGGVRGVGRVQMGSTYWRSMHKSAGVAGY